jgi:predicted Holliday junction resolvase-like endonuclease
MALYIVTADQLTTTLGQVVLLLALIFREWAQTRRDVRTRKWMQEDAVIKQQQLEDHERKMKAQLDAQTKEIKSNLEKRTQEISSHFDSLLEDRK